MTTVMRRTEQSRVPEPTGRRVTREGRSWLTHRRRMAAKPETAWEALTSPETLGRWVGTWRRSPDPLRAAGTVLTFEGDDLLPVRYRLDVYDEGRAFTVSLCDPASGDPAEVLVEVADAPSATAVGAVITLTHSVANQALAPHLAAGCEFYLDRLVCLLEHRRATGPGGLDGADFDDYFVAHAAYYRRLFPLAWSTAPGSETAQ